MIDLQTVILLQDPISGEYNAIRTASVGWPCKGDCHEARGKAEGRGREGSAGTEEGVVVLSVKEGTGAAKSDLKKGDIIIKINDKKTKDIAHLRYELYQHQSGDTIEITYIRNGHEHKTKVTLSSDK